MNRKKNLINVFKVCTSGVLKIIVSSYYLLEVKALTYFLMQDFYF